MRKLLPKSVTIRAAIIGAAAIVLTSIIQVLFTNQSGKSNIIIIDEKGVKSEDLNLPILLNKELIEEGQTKKEVLNKYSKYCYELLLIDNSLSTFKEHLYSSLNQYFEINNSKICLIGIMSFGEKSLKVSSFNRYDIKDITSKINILNLNDRFTNFLSAINEGVNIINYTHSTEKRIVVFSEFISHAGPRFITKIEKGNITIDFVVIGRATPKEEIQSMFPFVDEVYYFY